MWPDSGGPGMWRGGTGTRTRVRMLGDGMLTARIADRSIFPPRGIKGGKPGAGGHWIVNEGESNEVRLPPKVTNVPLKAGDVLTACGSGGGGLGNPWERDPALVLRDVRAGRVSVDAARAQYGVAVSATPDDIAAAILDEGGTQSLRAALFAKAGDQ